MSIKGIENQIMVARTAEVSQNQSLQNARRGELAQNQVVAQSQLQEAQETRSVVRSEETAQAEIRRDEQGKGGREGDEQKRRKQRPPEDELPAGFGESHKIDIKI